MGKHANRNASTRRDLIRYGGAVTGAGLLAGCLGDGSGDSRSGGGSDGTDESGGAETEELNGSEGGESDGNDDPADSYSVEMAPVSELTLDSVPEDLMVYSLLYADTAVAFGHGDDGDLVFAATDRDEPFITAERPVRARR